jgi:DNA-binding transcriptional regulator YiaG
MPNIATVLKEEIARVARKEVRAETHKLKSASARYRADTVALKRRIAELEQQIRRLGKAGAKTSTVATEPLEPQRRFSAKALAAHRVRLGLSAAEMATLLGVSAQSVYKWEDGKARPRASQLAAIATVRALGKREAAARLAALAP